MPARRGVLTTMGAMLSLSISGCSQDGPIELDPPFEEQARLGEAPAMSFEVEPTHEYMYLPEEHAVRYETSGPQHVTHEEQLSFAEWGTRRATHHAYERLQSLLETEFPDHDLITTWMGSLPVWEIADGTTEPQTPESEFKRAVELGLKVEYYHVYDANGELRRTPDIPWKTLIATVPRTMDVTMLFPERRYTAILPVQCRRELEVKSDNPA
jgi:predicted small lipoprotein YifL